MKQEGQNKKALTKSIAEGSAAAISSGITVNYITPFALKLNATEKDIGFLSSLTGIASPIAQLIGSKLIKTYSRKKIVLVAVLFQALTWLPIAALAIIKILYPHTIPLVVPFIVLYALLAAFGGIAHPAWFSWMGDLVPEKERGSYFARRNIIIGVIEIVAMLLGARILLLAESTNQAIAGFIALFLIAAISRLFSLTMLLKQYSPHPIPRSHYTTSFKEVKNNNPNFLKFMKYQLYFNLAIMIASPFFAVYMLNILHYTTVQYTLVVISSTVFYLLWTPVLGKFSDTYGNKPLLIIANTCFILSPLAWILLKTPLLLIIIPQFIAGLANAAFVLAFTNITYQNLKEEDRGTGVAYLNIAVGIGTFIGSLIGGYLLNYLPKEATSYFIVFFLAALSRALVALIFLPGIQEGRKVSTFHILHHSHIQPFKSLTAELSFLAHEVNPAQYLKRKKVH